MKKNNKISLFITFCLCLLVGLTIPKELKYKEETTEFIPLSTVYATKLETKNVSEEIEDLKELIEKKKVELDRWENSKGANDILQVVTEDLDYYKSMAGKVTLRGPGIRLRIGDSLATLPSSSGTGEVETQLIHDMDVLNIINDLKAAGAEAISINGERLVNNSGINCGGPIILINQESVTAPFVISAIGDAKQLYAAVSAPDTYGYILKNVWKLDVDTIISDNIYIRGNDQLVNFEYMKVKEGE